MNAVLSFCMEHLTKDINLNENANNARNAKWLHIFQEIVYNSWIAFKKKKPFNREVQKPRDYTSYTCSIQNKQRINREPDDKNSIIYARYCAKKC